MHPVRRLSAALLSLSIVFGAGCVSPREISRGESAVRLVQSDTSSGNSSDSGNSSQSDSGGSSGSSNGQSTGNIGPSSAESTGNTFQSKYPSSVQTSDASRPSSAQSSESSKNSSDSTNSSSQNSSHTQSQTNVLPAVLSTVTLGSTAGAIGLTIWLAVKPSPAAKEAAHAFLRANELQLQQDLALGAGRSIEDLAALARIRRENLPTFAHVLHVHRTELLDLCDGRTLTPDRAVLALRRIGELANLEPALADDGRAAVAAFDEGARAEVR